MNVWAPEDTDRTALADTDPPPVDPDVAAALRPLVENAAKQAEAVSTALAALDGRVDDAVRAIARGTVTDADRDRLVDAKLHAFSSMTLLHLAVDSLVAAMRLYGQDAERCELDLAGDRIIADRWRVDLGVWDRREPNRGYHRYERPLPATTDDYEWMAKGLRSYLADLSPGAP